MECYIGPEGLARLRGCQGLTERGASLSVRVPLRSRVSKEAARREFDLQGRADGAGPLPAAHALRVLSGLARGLLRQAAVRDGDKYPPDAVPVILLASICPCSPEASALHAQCVQEHLATIVRLGRWPSLLARARHAVVQPAPSSHVIELFDAAAAPASEQQADATAESAVDIRIVPLDEGHRDASPPQPRRMELLDAALQGAALAGEEDLCTALAPGGPAAAQPALDDALVGASAMSYAWAAPDTALDRILRRMDAAVAAAAATRLALAQLALLHRPTVLARCAQWAFAEARDTQTAATLITYAIPWYSAEERTAAVVRRLPATLHAARHAADLGRVLLALEGAVDPWSLACAALDSASERELPTGARPAALLLAARSVAAGLNTAGASGPPVQRLPPLRHLHRWSERRRCRLRGDISAHPADAATASLCLALGRAALLAARPAARGHALLLPDHGAPVPVPDVTCAPHDPVAHCLRLSGEGALSSGPADQAAVLEEMRAALGAQGALAWACSHARDLPLLASDLCHPFTEDAAACLRAIRVARAEGTDDPDLPRVRAALPRCLRRHQGVPEERCDGVPTATAAAEATSALTALARLACLATEASARECAVADCSGAVSLLAVEAQAATAPSAGGRSRAAAAVVAVAGAISVARALLDGAARGAAWASDSGLVPLTQQLVALLGPTSHIAAAQRAASRLAAAVVPLCAEGTDERSGAETLPWTPLLRTALDRLRTVLTGEAADTAAP